MRAATEEAQSKLKTVNRIRKSLTSITTSADRAREDVDGMVADVEQCLVRVESLIEVAEEDSQSRIVQGPENVRDRLRDEKNREPSVRRTRGCDGGQWRRRTTPHRRIGCRKTSLTAAGLHRLNLMVGTTDRLVAGEREGLSGS